MFLVHIATRRAGTIDLTSGAFTRDDAIAHIVATIPSSRLEADRILRDAGRLGLCRWSGGNFEVRAKLLATDKSCEPQRRSQEAALETMVQRA